VEAISEEREPPKVENTLKNKQPVWMKTGDLTWQE